MSGLLDSTCFPLFSRVLLYHESISGSSSWDLKICICFRHSKICDHLTRAANTDSSLPIQQKQMLEISFTVLNQFLSLPHSM